jgi:UDP-N-acetylmuramyl pentapeptide phosphotransferase/UDP-N-acetylglucosamine-1-phosphate transferase
MQMVNQLWVLFGGGFALAMIVTPLFIWGATRLGLVDHPAHRKIHSRPVTTMGGLSIFITLGIVQFFFTLSHSSASTLTRSSFSMKDASIFSAGLLLALWGAVDDVFHLSSRTKFAGQFVVAFMFAILGYRFEVLHLPGFQPYDMPDWMAVGLTVFWILAILNAFNMVDGVDGLASSVCLVTFLFIASVAAFFDNGGELAFALAALGAVTGFLFFNWKPAQIYLGDSGSSGLGMLIAGSLIALGHSDPLFQAGPVSKPYQPFHYQIILVSFFAAYPVLEINLSVFRRLLRSRPIHLADQGHIHHRLLKKGWNSFGIIGVAILVSLLPGLGALSTIMGLKGWGAWYLVLSALILGLGLPVLGFLDFLAPRFLTTLRPHYRIAHHFISMQKIKLSMATSREEVLTLVEQACQELGVHSYRLLVLPDEDRTGGLDYKHSFNPSAFVDHKNAQSAIDRVKLMSGKAAADWVFDPRREEEELDMEYRILISEFMKASLESIARLGRGQNTLELKSLSPLPRHKVSGNQLRKRHTI